MVDIQSKEVIDKISDELKIQPALQIPRQLAKDIQLVYGINPERLVQAVSSSSSDATASTIYTTSTTKRTFLIGAQLSLSKDVLATSLNARIDCVPLRSGVAVDIVKIRLEPLTVAQGLNDDIHISIPMELEKGSILQIRSSTAIGSIDMSAVILFYETDPQ